MKLHELVSAACKDDEALGDPLTLKSRRLACHVALLRELSSSGSFGALNGLMGNMTSELMNALYADAATLMRLDAGDSTIFHIKPNFVALEDARETIREKDAANEFAWSAMREAWGRGDLHNITPAPAPFHHFLFCSQLTPSCCAQL